MVKTLRREEQPNGCGALSWRGQFGDGRSFANLIGLVGDWAEEQAYDSNCPRM